VPVQAGRRNGKLLPEKVRQSFSAYHKPRRGDRRYKITQLEFARRDHPHQGRDHVGDPRSNLGRNTKAVQTREAAVADGERFGAAILRLTRNSCVRDSDGGRAIIPCK